MSEKGMDRRRFISTLAAGACALSSFSLTTPNNAVEKVRSRPSKSNLFQKNGKPLLVDVKGKDAEDMLPAGLNALGGLRKIADKIKTVLIKPNFVAAQPYPVISDPDFVFLLAKHCLEVGFEEVVVADISTLSERGKRRREKFETLGIYQRGKDVGAKVICGKLDEKSDYVFTYEDRWQRGEPVGIHRLIYNAPFIINTSVLKRHVPGYMSAALKNNFIAYGPQRRKAHQFAKKGGESYKYFDQCLVEFADAINPELTIIDAWSILIKSGPTLGYGAEIKPGINRMIFSGDMVAIDTLTSSIMEQYDNTFRIEMIKPYLSYASQVGLGTTDLGKTDFISLSV